MTYLYSYQTPLGRITIAEGNSAIIGLFFDNEPHPTNGIIKETALLKIAAQQLNKYMAGCLRCFSLPLAPRGTLFMREVWTELQRIPYGETRSYQQVARSVGRPQACRAVGQANHRNPIPIFIPCHRVIGASGKLVGYGGGLAVKSFLLDLEKRNL